MARSLSINRLIALSHKKTLQFRVRNAHHVGIVHIGGDLYGAVVVYPLLNMVYTSFFSWSGIAGVELQFAGLSNYIKFWTAPETSSPSFSKMEGIGPALGSRRKVNIRQMALYKQAFTYGKFGYANAISVMMVLLCLLIALLVNHIFAEHELPGTMRRDTA